MTPWGIFGMCGSSRYMDELQCGHGDDTVGNQVQATSAIAMGTELQCGHGDDTVGNLLEGDQVERAVVASMRPRR